MPASRMRLLVVTAGPDAVATAREFADAWPQRDRARAFPISDGSAGLAAVLNWHANTTGDYLAWRGTSAYIDGALILADGVEHLAQVLIDATAAGATDLIIGLDRVGPAGYGRALGKALSGIQLPPCRLIGPDLAAAIGARGLAAHGLSHEGLTPQDAQRRDDEAQAAAEVLAATWAPDLLGQTAGQRLARTPGAGLAAGNAMALLALGATAGTGSDLVATVLDLPGAIAAADLVVIHMPALDWHALGYAWVHQVSDAAAAVGVPVVVATASSVVGRRDTFAAGLAGVVVAPGDLGALAARTARTWSPAR